VFQGSVSTSYAFVLQPLTVVVAFAGCIPVCGHLSCTRGPTSCSSCSSWNHLVQMIPLAALHSYPSRSLTKADLRCRGSSELSVKLSSGLGGQQSISRPSLGVLSEPACLGRACCCRVSLLAPSPPQSRCSPSCVNAESGVSSVWHRRSCFETRGRLCSSCQQRVG